MGNTVVSRIHPHSAQAPQNRGPASRQRDAAGCGAQADRDSDAPTAWVPVRSGLRLVDILASGTPAGGGDVAVASPARYG
jgi:hypothetical protein